MTDGDSNVAWLQQRTMENRDRLRGMSEVIDDFNDVGKLEQEFSSVDELVEINLGKEQPARPTYVNQNLSHDQKGMMCELLEEFQDYFAWDYSEMPGLSRELVEHALPIEHEFMPYKQLARSFNPKILSRVKEEVERLLKANFIRTCHYIEWVSNIVPVEKNTGKIRICVDFRDLNKATPKGEYMMPMADALINRAFGHWIISFMDGNAGYNQIFMAEDDIPKMTFRCPGFVGLFEWVVMTFGLKNAGATYQRAMNLILHDLLEVILEVYIDDLVVKSATFEGHLVHLRLAFKRMRKYNLKMNPLNCAFGVSVGRFLGFVVHENGIEIDPKNVESIRKIGEPTCKKDVQKLLGKINYL
jgi:hypothetical protein